MINIKRKYIIILVAIIIGCIFMWLFSNIAMELNKAEVQFDYTKFKNGANDENLVREYNEFEMLQNILSTCINTLQNEKPSDTYVLLTKNMKKLYPLNRYKELIVKYTNENLMDDKAGLAYDSGNFDTTDILVSANKIESVAYTSTYLIKYKNKANKIKELGIIIDTKNGQYYIANIEM